MFSVDLVTRLVTQVGLSGHLLGLSDDADQVLIADASYQNWYLVYLEDAHAIAVRYPSSPQIVDIRFVARQPRYAELFAGGGPLELVVADGDGNVPVDAYTAGNWVVGAFVPDGSAVLSVEDDGKDTLFVRYESGSGRGEVHGRGKLGSRPVAPTDQALVRSGSAAASPDGKRLAVSTPEGVVVLYQPSSG